MEGEHGVAGDLQVPLERLGRIREEPRVGVGAIRIHDVARPVVGRPPVARAGGVLVIDAVLVRPGEPRGRGGERTVGTEIPRLKLRLGQRPGARALPCVLTHRSVHELALCAARAPHVPVEEAEILEPLSLHGRLQRRVRRAIRARVLSRSVAPRGNDRALRVGQGHEAMEHALGRAGVGPARPGVDGRARALDLGRVGVDAPPVHRDPVPEGHALVLEPERAERLPDRRDVPAPLHGGREQAAVGILVDGLHPDRRAAAAAPWRVEVHLLHAESPVRPHVGVRHPAREVEVGVRVEVGESRDAGLERRMVHLGEPVVRVRRVGVAPPADRAVGPRLRHDPVHDVAEVQRLVPRPVVRPRPVRSARAARVPPHHRVALAGEKALQLVRTVAFPRAPVAGHGQDGRHALPRGKPLGEHDVERDAHSVPHRHVEGAHRAHAVGAHVRQPARPEGVPRPGLGAGVGGRRGAGGEGGGSGEEGDPAGRPARGQARQPRPTGLRDLEVHGYPPRANRRFLARPSPTSMSPRRPSAPRSKRTGRKKNRSPSKLSRPVRVSVMRPCL